eukprot:Blabericola_migrator_1__2179@NODE_15_length_23605_cov_67_423868_g12_i0_p6_GENE_NODE_15_length_23605_cov_67_423868_g12_i0NODE_15_length_23605_cov_67_423868_g12_i0_p6_ORF_typecomplete_len645_score88_87NTP_transf_2/PF01909_23/1_7e12PAP_assoc/PF03828_19/2_6e08_NODE_15_length_23605_cov_67_423868_g12_i0802014
MMKAQQQKRRLNSAVRDEETFNHHFQRASQPNIKRKKVENLPPPRVQAYNDVFRKTSSTGRDVIIIDVDEDDSPSRSSSSASTLKQSVSPVVNNKGTSLVSPSPTRHPNAKQTATQPTFSLYEALHDLKKEERAATLDSIFSNPLPRDKEATQAAANFRDLLRQVRTRRLQQQALSQQEEADAEEGSLLLHPSPLAEPAFEEAIALSALPAQPLLSRDYQGPAVSETPWCRWFRFNCGDPSLENIGWVPPNRPSLTSQCRWWSQQPFTWRLHHEVAAFACWSELTSFEVRQRQEVIARVYFVVKTIWPTCEVQPFGSFVTGLSLPCGDMDICINDVPCSKAADAVIELARAMKRSRLGMNVTAITKARIPIVKYIDPISRIHVDISVNQESSEHTTNLVARKLKEWPQLRPLILIMKETLRQWELGETYKGGVGSYLLFCLTLHHLQHTEDLEKRNLGELLIGFLDRFSYFNYYSDGIDVRGNGRLIMKADMHRNQPMDNLLCVSSPLEPQTDCGRNSYKIDVIVERLRRRLDRLLSIESAEKRAAESRDMTKLNEIRSSSLLSAVVHHDEEVFETRRIPSNHPPGPNFSIYHSREQHKVPEHVYEDVYKRVLNVLPRVRDSYECHSSDLSNLRKYTHHHMTVD